MYGFLLIIHILICVALMLVVLLQSGKGGGLAGTFGWTGAQTLFGGRGAGTVLSKATSVLGGAFMLTSLTLALLTGVPGKTGGKGLLQKARERDQAEQPVSRPSTRLPTGAIPQAPSPASQQVSPQAKQATQPAAPAGEKQGSAKPAGKSEGSSPVKEKGSQTKTGETGGK